MTISKRDTIIIAVLVNTGLLAILFMTALRFDEDSIQNPSASTTLAFQEPLPSANGEELSLFPSSEALPVSAPLSSSPKRGEEPSLKTSSEEYAPLLSSSEGDAKGTKELPHGEVTVKKGDVLEKIARANGVTIEEIKAFNRLSSDRLNVGQVLKIPGASSKITPLAKPKLNESIPEGVVYHVIKSGDNPWKVARQYQVKYEDILKLNGLNEEKARNLKIGDKIRVK